MLVKTLWITSYFPSDAVFIFRSSRYHKKRKLRVIYVHFKNKPN